MKNKWIVLMIIIGVFGLVSGCGRSNHSAKNDRLIKMVSKRLQLDDHQKAKLMILNEELENFHDGMLQDRSQFKEDMITLLETDDLGQQQLMNVLEERKKQIDGLAPRVIGAVVEFHDSLNQEQKREVAEEFKKHALHSKHNGRHIRKRSNS